MSIELASHAFSRRLAIIDTAESLSAEDEPGISAFARAVRDGLNSKPKTLPFSYLYDRKGSMLFEQICRLPEYYPTRTEDLILRENSLEMTDGWDIAPTMIELGSGSAEKTRRLIAAAITHHGRLHYVPIDVSAGAVESSAIDLARAFPQLRVTGYVGDYHASLSPIIAKFPGPKLLLFLGSSLGNYTPAEASALLSTLAAEMGENDRLLLGTDLAKPASILEPAYDDKQGVTAQFNLNLLSRINRELGADFSVDQFRHRAVYLADRGRVEMHLVSRIDQAVRIPAADLTVEFAEGESIHTENSHKYTIDSLHRLASEAGFVEETAWTDRKGWFRVQRWRTRNS